MSISTYHLWYDHFIPSHLNTENYISPKLNLSSRRFAFGYLLTLCQPNEEDDCKHEMESLSGKKEIELPKNRFALELEFGT